MKERKMNENLREGIADAILANFNPPDDKHSSWWFNEDRTVDAVLAVVGPELDRLRTEVEAADERNVRLARRISELHDERNADVTDLRTRLAKVEALGDGRWDHSWGCSAHSGGECDCWLSALRAVLASVPEPSDSEPAPDVQSWGVDPRCLCTYMDGKRYFAIGCRAHEEPAPDADREAGER